MNVERHNKRNSKKGFSETEQTVYLKRVETTKSILAEQAWDISHRILTENFRLLCFKNKTKKRKCKEAVFLKSNQPIS